MPMYINEPNNADNSPIHNNHKKNKDIDYYDLWKYCEEVGGKDKDRMVTIVTWLLAFAIAILGYIIIKEIDFNSIYHKVFIKI